MNLAQTKTLLSCFNIQPTRSLGQNFLVDERVVSRIVDLAAITKADCVLEIGPGLGHLTIELAKSAGQVIAIEIDKHILPALKHNLTAFSNVTVIHSDALDLDFPPLLEHWNGTLKVVANLPYYVTTDLMQKVMIELPFCQNMTLMMQKEAAERIMAPIGSKGYSPAGVIAASIGSLRRILTVGRGSYFPQPHVDSVVLQLTPWGNPLVAVKDLADFNHFLHSCFRQRRKTLLNNLNGQITGIAGEIPVETVGGLLDRLAIKRDIRAESVTATQFAELYYSILEISNTI